MLPSEEPVEEKKPKLPSGNAVYHLRPGFAWNPLLKIPRNQKCPCDSGKKFKHCHLINMPRAIPEKFAHEYVATMKNVELLKFVEDATPVEKTE